MSQSEKSLILLGKGPLKEQCPFDKEVWGTLSLLTDKEWWDKPYSKLFIVDTVKDDWPPLIKAQEKGYTITGRSRYPYVTDPMPLSYMKERFGSVYLMNNLSYMIAMALYLGYENLDLWGVWGPAPEKLWPGAKYITYWLGVATGVGVEWKLCPDYDIWKDCYAPDVMDPW